METMSNVLLAVGNRKKPKKLTPLQIKYGKSLVKVIGNKSLKNRLKVMFWKIVYKLSKRGQK